MKYILQTMVSVLLISLIISSELYAQLPTFTWAKAVGGSGFVRGNSVCTDAAGNSYTLGTFNAEADFNPDPTETNILASFGEDIFVVKLDSDGDFVWAIRIGGDGVDEGNSIAIDDNGNLIITGKFQQTVDFNPKAGIFNLSSQGGSDIFIAKLSPDGDLIWARNLGSEGSDDSEQLALDDAGAIFFAGQFSDLGRLYPDDVSVSANGNFICKLNTNGTFQWAANLGNADLRGIAISNANDILVTGDFSGTVDFDPGAGVAELSSFVDGIFIAKYTHEGDYVWAHNIGGGDYDSQGTAIATDVSGAVFVTGNYAEDTDFDPGAGTFMLDGNIRGLAFILKLDSDGNFEWAQEFDAYESNGSNVKVDADGNVWVLGDTNPEGPWSTFLAVFDSEGEELAEEDFGTDCFGNSLALGANGEAFITGWFQDYTDFDFGPDETGITPIAQDLYILKLGGVPAQPVDEEFEIFNFISANGDETNACLYIQNIEASESTRTNTVKIFNRWGDVVWETKNYNNTDRAFKGKTDSGNELPSGTYYYKIEFAEGKTRTGFLSLLR